jgi:hypothetical protein
VFGLVWFIGAVEGLVASCHQRLGARIFACLRLRTTNTCLARRYHRKDAANVVATNIAKKFPSPVQCEPHLPNSIVPPEIPCSKRFAPNFNKPIIPPVSNIALPNIKMSFVRLRLNKFRSRAIIGTYPAGGSISGL